MLIVDAHLDLAWNACQWERDLRLPVAAIRDAEAGRDGPGRGRGTVALPELRQANVAVAIVTLLARTTGETVPGLDYATVAEANAVARSQLAWYRALERDGELVVVEDAAALHAHVDAWRAWESATGGPQPPLGVVLGMEGADPITAPSELPEWHQAGLRIVGLAHYGAGRYAGGTHTDAGLTDLGRSLVRVMHSCGTILDLTHCTDAGVAEALELHDGPVLASHSNARALVPHPRQLTDAQIAAIAARGGVVGVAFDCWMLDPAWVHGQADNDVTIAAVADHVDHICQLTGTSDHVGVGSDLDGGFGREQTPRDLDTIADLQLLAGHLRDRGYRDEDVAAVMHGNWLRLLGAVLP